MKIDLNVTVTLEASDTLASLLANLPGQMLRDDLDEAAGQPETKPASKPETKPEAKPETKPDAPGQAAAADTILDTLINKFDKSLSRTQSVSLGDNTRASVESEVFDPENVVAVVRGTWRGKAVVEYEDGKAKAFDAKDLRSVPQEDTPPDTGNSNVVQMEKDEIVVPDDDGEIVVPDNDVTIEEIRDAMDVLCAEKGRQQAVDIMRAHHIKKVGDLKPEDYGKFLTALQDAAAA